MTVSTPADMLIAELAESLGTADEPLDDAADVIRRRLGAHRVSIARFDSSDRSFRVMATAGASLCAKGTTLPVATSSHYARVSDGDLFASKDFAQLPGFTEACDLLITTAGFRSGLAVPLNRGRERIGAVNIASFERGVDYRAWTGALAAIGGMLTVALSRQVDPVGPAVLVCHADPIVAHGIARLCETNGASRTMTALSVEDAVERLERDPADIIICDNYVGGLRVDEFAAALRRSGAGAALLVVASHDTPDNLRAAVGAGAAGYLARSEVPGELALAIATLCCGRTILPEGHDGEPSSEHLTGREREVLLGLDEGLRVKQIALRLGISEATAKTHARNLFRKLDATSRHEVVRAARRVGLLA